MPSLWLRRWSGSFIPGKPGCERLRSAGALSRCFCCQTDFDPGSPRVWPKEDRVVKSLWMKSILACVVVTMAAGLASAQNFNPPPCDFSNQFYGDNGVLACTDSTCSTLAGELN